MKKPIMNKNILEVKNLSLSFGGIKAVDDVSFNVGHNEVVSLIGPNGAGKTTIFNLLTGFYKPDHGEIFKGDKKLNDKSPQEIVKTGISRTFQNIRLFSDMRVIENVLVGTHIRTKYSLFDSTFRTRKYRKEEDSNTAYAMTILSTLGLFDKKDQFASNLPYGDQRKVEIARAIATGAELLLLDEPAAGMNTNESIELMDFVKYLKSLGFTILLIEHDMSVVMNISDRVYVLDNGSLISEGIPSVVANDANVIEAYLGGTLNVNNQ